MKLFLSAVFCCCWMVFSEASPTFKWDNVDFLLAFGDSYTYVQGTAGRQNYSFIGDALNFGFAPKTLSTNKIVRNQTSAGGPNWVQYLTGCFSGMPSRCKTQLWDFAFAGSDVSTTYIPLHHNFTVSFEEQIVQWATYAKPVLSVKVFQALVAIFIGINDLLDSATYTFPRNNAADHTSFYTSIMEAQFNSMEKIYEAGYQDFLVMNVPPLERIPSNQISPNPLPSRAMVLQYNSIISSTAAEFVASHPGANAMVFDTYSFLSGVLDNPSEYGIRNTTSYCPNYNAPDIATNYAAYGCLPIERYFWYDPAHITWSIHKHLATAVAEFLAMESL